MKKSFIAFLFVLACASGGTAAQEKDGAASGIVEKSLQSLKEMGKAQLQKALGEKTPATASQTDSFTLPKKPEAASQPRYSPGGKRDPFRPPALKEPPTARSRENLSPLERYELGQLKLVGIVWDIRDPRAMVEDAAGLGYAVKVGTPIGQSDGKVRAIKPTEVVIEEVYTDFYGARKNRVVAMKLPSE